MKHICNALALSAISTACMQAYAVDFKAGDGIEGKFNGTVTFGTQIRTEAPSPDAYADWPSRSIPGITKGNLQGQTGGSDLNFGKGSQISTVLKGVFDLELRKENIGVFVRSTAWKDFALGENNAAYGNYPNGFTPNSPLSDRGFDSSSKFSNVELRDYFIFGKFNVGEGKTLDARLGRQVLQWGGSMLTTGGINSAINPTDFSSQLRPGALPFEGKLPLGMLSAKLATGTAWSFDGFAAYEFRGAALPGCGTYFDVASYAPEGCDFAALAGASEKNALISGAYLHRNADIKAKSLGQFGLSLGYKAESLATDFKAYAMNTHSSMPSLRMTINNTAPFTGIGPGLAAANYSVLYPQDVALFGLSFNKKLDPAASLFGEVAYRPNQPLTLNAYDLVLGSLRVPGSVLALNKGLLNVPAGGTFDAYDRFGVITGSLGGNKVFPKALGADRVVLAGEVGYSHVNGLPDTAVLRYGRALPYNGAAYTGGAACVDAVPGKTCTSDGYISSNAWGLRVVASATYPNAIGGATLTPSVLIAKDIKGYSYDGTFSEGRTLIRSSLRADMGKSYFAEIQYSVFSGGKYNLLIDRNFVSLVAGARF